MRSRSLAPVLAANVLPVSRRSWKCRSGTPTAVTASDHPTSLRKSFRRRGGWALLGPVKTSDSGSAATYSFRCRRSSGRMPAGRDTRGRNGPADGEGELSEASVHLPHFPTPDPPVRAPCGRVRGRRRDQVPAVALDVDPRAPGQLPRGHVAARVGLEQVPAAIGPSGGHARRRRHQLRVDVSAVPGVDVDPDQSGDGAGPDRHQATR